MLSFVAGLVNVTGVLAVNTLTTNVTGHFAYFAEELVNKHYGIALVFLLFIVFFLLGAFVSNVLVELISRINPKISHSGPMVLEILVLVTAGMYGISNVLSQTEAYTIAYSLLFAMGLQNALVTQVSQFTVRTTHLTGLFTDLGIELSQLFFYRKTSEFQRLIKSIRLRIFIIVFFFLGCVTGGFLFTLFNLKTLLVAAVCLTIAFMYDNLLYRFYFLKRKLVKQQFSRTERRYPL